VRSHPPTLLTLVRATIVREKLFQRGDVVLVAVSGGPDSMALLHALVLLRAKLGHRVVAHGVDHGLRAEAGGELDLAERFARAHEVPFARSAVRIAPGGNLQARARAARYAALREAAGAASARVVATAHHADDRAETVLLRLLRGAGPAGLAVLPPREDDGPCAPFPLVRPLLLAHRHDVEAHRARHDVPCATDPSNADPRFLRVRVRRELIPLLTSMSPHIVDHLCALADQLRAAPDPLRGLPRAARDALATLARERRKNARVALGYGLAARVGRTNVDIVVEPEDRPKRTRASSTK
jgi:tRNA(Ile)-lysidine synthase